MEYKRITADFDTLAYKNLGEVSTMMHSSKADALRRALSLTHYILEQRVKGNRIVIEDENGENRREIMTF